MGQRNRAERKWGDSLSGVISKYREVLTFVDRFTALRFTATGAPPNAMCIQILQMNQYAW
jgi:hypothetical protein